MEEEKEMVGLEEEKEDWENLEERQDLEDQQKMSLSFHLGRLLPLTVLRAWPQRPRRR